MRAFFRDDQSAIDPNGLEANGVIYRRLGTDPAVFRPALEELRSRRGYVDEDVVSLAPETPNLDVALAKFSPEHSHTDDEVRFVLEGEGVFDIRSNDQRWMRVVVEPGDLIVVPAGKRHRFELTETKTIRCARLFKDKGGWTPVYVDAAP